MFHIESTHAALNFYIITFFLFYFLHLEGGGKGGAVLFLAQGSPVHLAAVDVDFPPLAVLLPLIYPCCTMKSRPGKVEK